MSTLDQQARWRVEPFSAGIAFMDYRLLSPEGAVIAIGASEAHRAECERVAAALNEAEQLRADLDAARARIEELEAALRTIGNAGGELDERVAMRRIQRTVHEALRPGDAS